MNTMMKRMLSLLTAVVLAVGLMPTPALANGHAAAKTSAALTASDSVTLRSPRVYAFMNGMAQEEDSHDFTFTCNSATVALRLDSRGEGMVFYRLSKEYLAPSIQYNEALGGWVPFGWQRYTNEIVLDGKESYHLATVTLGSQSGPAFQERSNAVSYQINVQGTSQVEHYQMSTRTSPEGGGSVSIDWGASDHWDASDPFAAGSQATITATPHEEYRFDGWSDQYGNAHILSPNSSTTRFTMPDSAYNAEDGTWINTVTIDGIKCTIPIVDIVARFVEKTPTSFQDVSPAGPSVLDVDDELMVYFNLATGSEDLPRQAFENKLTATCQGRSLGEFQYDSNMADGVFTVSASDIAALLPQGAGPDCTITLRYPGDNTYKPCSVSIPVKVVQKQQPQLVDFTPAFSPFSTPFTIAGKIVDESGDPIANKEISVAFQTGQGQNDFAYHNMKTAANGAFSVAITENLPSAAQTRQVKVIAAKDDDYRRLEETRDIAFTDTFPIALNLSPSFGGTATLSTQSAKAGTKVVVTPSPAESFEVDAVTYAVAGGSPVVLAPESADPATGATTSWSFLMPAGATTVNVSFAEDGVAIDETNFPNASFRAFVGQNYDTNGTGKLSVAELAAVTSMNCARKGIGSVQGIGNFPNLKELNVSNNSLTEIDLSQNTALEVLKAGSNQISAIDLSANKALRELNLDTNDLSAIDLSENASLTKLLVYGNRLSELDVSNNPLITNLQCHGNDFTELNLLANGALKHAVLAGTRDTSADGYDRYTATFEGAAVDLRVGKGVNITASEPGTDPGTGIDPGQNPDPGPGTDPDPYPGTDPNPGSGSGTNPKPNPNPGPGPNSTLNPNPTPSPNPPAGNTNSKGNSAGKSGAKAAKAKAKNTLSVKGKKVVVSSTKLKKKSQTIKRAKAFKVKAAKGKVVFKVKKHLTKASKGKISVTKSGKVKVKKGLKKKTYKLKVTVTAKGNRNYKKLSKTTTLTIVVK